MKPNVTHWTCEQDSQTLSSAPGLNGGHHLNHHHQRKLKKTIINTFRSETHSAFSCMPLMMLLPTAVDAWLLSSCSAAAGPSPDAGAAHRHRPVGGSVAGTPDVPGQDQNRLPDGDGVEPVGVRSPGPEGGAEVTGALGLPDSGRDLVGIGGGPEGEGRRHTEDSRHWSVYFGSIQKDSGSTGDQP